MRIAHILCYSATLVLTVVVLYSVTGTGNGTGTVVPYDLPKLCGTVVLWHYSTVVLV